MDKQIDRNQAPVGSVPQLKNSSLFSKYLPIIIVALIMGVIGSAGTYLALKQSNTPAQNLSQTPSPTPTPDPSFNWKIYANDKYSFKYPVDWDVAQLDFTTPTLLIAPKINVDVLRRVNFQVGGGKNGVMTIIGPSYNSPADAFVSDATKSVTSNPVIIAGLNSTEYTTTYKAGFEGMRVSDVTIHSIVENDGKKYAMILVDAAYNDIYNQILSTFKFTN